MGRPGDGRGVPEAASPLASERTDARGGGPRQSEARRGAACDLVGADPSAKTPVHPLRWPGTWHLKGKPKLARIVALNAGAEINLGDAEDALRAALREGAGASNGTAEADPALIASALRAIPNADLHWNDWIRFGLATWRATAGSTAGLDAWREWSEKSKKFTKGKCEERWAHFAKSPPSKIGAGTIFYAALAAGWTWPKDTQSPVLRPEAPLESAIVFLARDRIMHHLQGTFYEWQGTHYTEVAREEMRAQLYAFLHKARRVTEKGTVPFDPSKFKVVNVLEAVAAEAQLPSTTRAPAWLDTTSLPPEELIVCTNGLLHFPKRALLAHTPALFSLNALPFDYNPAAPKPAAWLTFLGQLWPEDQDTINVLQEIFGLLLTGNTRHQKAFLLVGPKRSGKGTIARILRRLLGPANVCGPTLSSLATSFGLMPLIGKRLAIISDARLGGKTDQNVIVERILAITGEDALTVDRKYLDQWTGYLETRFVILTNELPRLTDASGALASRFITLVFTESFYGREDLGLTDKLATELPGILNWALKGLGRLQKRGYFVPPKSSAEAQRELEDLGSPVGAFLRDRCLIDPRRRVECNKLFLGWATWCQDNHRDFPGTTQMFARDLRAAVPGE